MNDTPRAKKVKPQKPYPEFPLYAHPSGMWAKKVRSQTRYFGTWDNPHGALEKYLAEKEYMYAGVTPPGDPETVTVDELVNRFLMSKIEKVEAGQLGERQIDDHKRTCRMMIKALGRKTPLKMLRPEDFARLRRLLAKGRGPVTVRNHIIRCRSVFKWGDAIRLTDRPFYGDEFSVPSAREVRRARYERPARLFSSAELEAMLEETDNPYQYNLRAMIWLGINCALGNTDCSMLKFDHLDLEAGILEFPRPKTEIYRRSVLWPETIAAVEKAIAKRRKMKDVPVDLEQRVFVTRRRCEYVRMIDERRQDSIGIVFGKLLKKLDIKRKGVGFYALRHTFRTIADETRDWPAIDLVMGHESSGISTQQAGHNVEMGARYRERIGDDRLRAVSEHVRAWLLGK